MYRGVQLVHDGDAENLKTRERAVELVAVVGLHAARTPHKDITCMENVVKNGNPRYTVPKLDVAGPGGRRQFKRLIAVRVCSGEIAQQVPVLRRVRFTSKQQEVLYLGGVPLQVGEHDSVH